MYETHINSSKVAMLHQETRSVLIVLLLASLLCFVGAENIRGSAGRTRSTNHANENHNVLARHQEQHHSNIRHRRPALQRSLGQRDLFADFQGPEIDPRTGRPKLLRSVGYRHLQAGEQVESENESDSSSIFDNLSNAKDTIQSTYEELSTIDETPPEEWSTAQKWGVAIGAIAAFMIVSCVVRCLFCMK